MKILITTVFFPPQNAIASQRPYSWALEWSKLGHDVTVLTTEKDLSKSDLSPVPMAGFRTVEISGSPLIGWLRGRRRSTLAASSNSPDRSLRKVKTESAFRSWLRARGFLSSVRRPDVFDLWVGPAVRAVESEKFDLIVSTFGPPASLSAGYRLKKKNPGAKWICDFRDLWCENHVYPGFWPITLFERFAEKRYLAKADGITTVSQALANSLVASLNAKVSVASSYPVAVFENGFFPEELRTLDPTSVFPESDRVKFVYTGSLHPEQRNPRPFFQALSNLLKDGFLKKDAPKLEIWFLGPRASWVEQMVRDFSLEDVVRFKESVPRAESLRFQRDADVLLFFEHQHESAKDGVLTGKLFEYLATGRPIWAIGVGPHSTVGSLIEKNRAGVAFGNDVDRLTTALATTLAARLKDGPAPQRDVSSPADISQQFDRSKIARRMLTWIETDVVNTSLKK